MRRRGPPPAPPTTTSPPQPDLTRRSKQLGLWNFSSSVAKVVRSDAQKKQAARVSAAAKRKRVAEKVEPRRSGRVKGDLAPNV